MLSDSEFIPNLITLKHELYTQKKIAVFASYLLGNLDEIVLAI
jgi:hypothetical protein